MWSIIINHLDMTKVSARYIAFYYCEQVRLFWSHVEEWTARISPRELVLLDVGYVVDNVNPPHRGEKRMVFFVILAVARMVIWETRNKGLYDGANFSHRDLILFFRHQLRVKIRCDRRRLDPYLHLLSSSSCCAGSTDIPDPLSPLLPIVHCPRQVFRTTFCILT